MKKLFLVATTLLLVGLFSLTQNVTPALSLPQCRPSDAVPPIGCNGAVCICSKRSCEWVGCV